MLTTLDLDQEQEAFKSQRLLEPMISDEFEVFTNGFEGNGGVVQLV